MTLLMLAAVLLLFAGGVQIGRTDAPGTEEETYLSPHTTTCMKGFFVLFVFFRHLRSYVTFQGPLDAGFRLIDSWLGQLIVALFLFYSGYGVMYSILKKKRAYVNRIPVKRFLGTYVQFWMAVTLFVLLAVLTGSRFGGRRLFLIYLGYSDAGNSNWFIVTILYLYLATWISAECLGRHRTLTCAAVGILGIVYLLVVREVKSDYWYNTLLCYPFGMLWARYRDVIDEKIRGKAYWLFAIGTTAAFLLFYRADTENALYYNFTCLLFAAAVVIWTMEVRPGNRFLYYLGKHLFPFYILQRLPMIALDKLGVSASPYLFAALSFAIVMALTPPFDALCKKTLSLLHISGKRTAARA